MVHLLDAWKGAEIRGQEVLPLVDGYGLLSCFIANDLGDVGLLLAGTPGDTVSNVVEGGNGCVAVLPLEETKSQIWRELGMSGEEEVQRDVVV